MVEAIEAAVAAHEKGRVMNGITPTRIATALGTLALLAGILATTATAEPGNPATEAAIAAQRTSVTATDKRSPDTRDAAGFNTTPTATPQASIVASNSVFDWTDAAIGAFAGFAIALLLGGMIVLSHRGRHGSLAV